MLTARWQPLTHLWQEMSRLNQDMDRFLAPSRSNGHWPGFALAFPAVNIWENDEAIFVEAELPGLNPDDLDLSVTGGNQLLLKGERKFPQVEQGVWHRRERGFGSFTRVIELPAVVDADRVEATFVNGVMTIRLPKHEMARPKKITIKTD